MAHNINGKVYTDHPLMDEIVYNCKLILDGIIVKNDVLANSFETDETLQNAEYLFIAKENRMSISICPFTADILMKEFGYSQELARACVWDHNNVPEQDKEAIVKFTSNQLVENYVEKNRYYRALCGLPEYGTNEYDIYLDYSYFPSNYHKEIDFSKPLHEMDDSIIAVLEATGKIKQILDEHPGSNYDYVRCLGDKKLDPYTVRKAGKWDILYLPPVEALVENRFKELYNLNKEVYLQRTYDEAYDFNSTYYDHSMILMVLCQTFTDMVVDVPEWYIRRDIFDIRSVQYFLESYGVKFFKEIPLKYQIRLVKNLNKLIKYKSTNRNCEDILEIFALKETEIYRYYLYKKRLTDAKGEYIESDDINKQFELEFVQCGLNDSYDNYIKDQVYRTPYDDITYQDKYWDGEDTHEYVKNLHMERDFTIEGTKYMSIEYKISMEKYLFQMQYFVSLLVDSRLDTSDVRVGIPSIQPGTTFRLSDLFLFLSVLSLEYDNCGTFVKRPNKYKSVSPTYSEEYYDWMKKWFPEVFDKKRNRVYGFNPNANLSEIQEVIGRRHSKYQFEHGFTLEELGVQHFEAPKKVRSIDDLIRLYRNNTMCYDNLQKIREEAVDNRDESLVMEYVFDSLFTKEFDYKYYELDSAGTEAETLEEILQNNDYVLYNLYLKITTEPNDEAKRDNIRAILNDVVNTLEYYLSGDGLEYIFSFTSVASFNSLVNYIYLIMNFFKSYKVYFLEPYVTYLMNGKIENFAGGMDVIAEKKLTYWKHDRHFLADAAVYNVFKYLEDRDGTNKVVEVLDIHGHFEGDPNDDYDYDGMYANSTGSGYKMADGGYADPFSCVPFVVLNGGSAQGSRMDLWDLNGATATELRDYVDIDAGYAYNPDDYVGRDYFASAFNYMIDGGGAATNHFFTNSMHVKVIDRQIEAQVRVSTAQYNNIVETEDGLYMQQQWSSWTDFEELETQTSNTYEYFSSMYNDLSDTIKISSDITILDDRIEKCIGYYVDGLRKVYDYMDTGTFEENLTNYTDERVAELYSEFYGFSPFTWEEF